MRFSAFTALVIVGSSFAAAPAPPEKPLNALFKQMAEKPVEVDGFIVAVKTIKVQGVIHGVNSDLTVTTQEGVPGRAVILNGKSWTSADGTKWEKAGEIDRSYAKMMMGPVIYTDRTNPPFEEVDREEKNGEVVQHIRLKVPKEDEKLDRPNYWIAWKNGKPVEIRRAEVPLLTGGRTIVVKADYRLTDEAHDVKAPVAGEKAPESSKQSAPEALLAAAKKNMATHPAWTFTATVEDEQAKKTMKLSGILEGENCDLTLAGDGDAGMRQKIIGEMQYASKDGGKTWQKTPVQRDYYFLVHTPLKSRTSEKIPPFEIVQTTDAGEGVSIMHVRFKAPDAVGEEGDRPNYWIALTDGKPSAVLRYHGPMGFRNHYVFGKVEYEPADLNDDGKPLITPPITRKKS